ncbi:MAG: helix-turn-helix domain-containing protein [Boseongicola sp. SB0662_bin_57]|nr:helix-turn-helix domain-containing protein [Boseongicola sp. SB0662_bin_57]
MAATEIAGVETALVASNLQRVLRTSRNIREDHNENCFLILQRSGRALMIQEDRHSMIMPGDMVLIDSAFPSEFVFFRDRSEQVSLHLPRQELMDRFGKAFEPGLAIPSGEATAKAIHAIMEQGLRSSDNDDSAMCLRESLFGVLGAFFFMRDSGEAPAIAETPLGGRAPILARAIAVVDARFSDPDFTASQLADDLGVAQRQLQRSFQELSVTPTRYLLARRLEAARDRIVERARSGSSELISRIAYECGFSDLSYFNRRFRDAFGAAPGGYGSGVD